MDVVRDGGPRGLPLHLWGKFSACLGLVYPLLFHLLDAAAVAGELWDRALSPAQRLVIARGLGLGERAARSVVMLVAGLHDLGKASRFQACEPGAWALVDERFKRDTEAWRVMRHERASMHVALHVLESWGYRLGGDDSPAGADRAGARRASRAFPAGGCAGRGRLGAGPARAGRACVAGDALAVCMAGEALPSQARRPISAAVVSCLGIWSLRTAGVPSGRSTGSTSEASPALAEPSRSSSQRSSISAARAGSPEIQALPSAPKPEAYDAARCCGTSSAPNVLTTGLLHRESISRRNLPEVNGRPAVAAHQTSPSVRLVAEGLLNEQV